MTKGPSSIMNQLLYVCISGLREYLEIKAETSSTGAELHGDKGGSCSSSKKIYFSINNTSFFNRCKNNQNNIFKWNLKNPQNICYTPVLWLPAHLGFHFSIFHFSIFLLQLYIINGTSATIIAVLIFIIIKLLKYVSWSFHL